MVFELACFLAYDAIFDNNNFINRKYLQLRVELVLAELHCLLADVVLPN